MPRRVDVCARVGDRGHLLEGGSLAFGVDEVLLSRLERRLDPVQPLTLVREVAYLWFPQLMRSIGDYANAEVYQGAVGKAPRSVVIGLEIAHLHSLKWVRARKHRYFQAHLTLFVFYLASGEMEPVVSLLSVVDEHESV